MLATVSRKAKQTCNTNDQRCDSKRRCRRSLCVMENSAMLQFSHWRQLWHSSLYPNGVIFETLWSLCREELLIWQVLQCYTFLIKGSFGVHLHTQMEWFSRDDDAEKNFRCGEFCNATIFWLKARSEDHLCMPKFTDVPEMMTIPMCQVLQCYSFLIEGGSGDPFAYSNGVFF